jgi:hypothetical protein
MRVPFRRKEDEEAVCSSEDDFQELCPSILQENSHIAHLLCQRAGSAAEECPM